MKPTEFADVLDRYASMVSPTDAEQLRMLATVFRSSPAPSVANTLVRLSKASFPTTSGTHLVSRVLQVIAPLDDFLQVYGKPAVAKDFAAVISFFEDYSDRHLDSLVLLAAAALANRKKPKPLPLNEDVVAKHVLQLENALGNDAAFPAAYNALEHDQDVGKLELAAIAKRFTDTSPKSRPATLKKIWARHHSLVTFEAKSRSRDGRSAA